MRGVLLPLNKTVEARRHDPAGLDHFKAQLRPAQTGLAVVRLLATVTPWSVGIGSENK